jgi:hypothetical protein
MANIEIVHHLRHDDLDWAVKASDLGRTTGWYVS